MWLRLRLSVTQTKITQCDWVKFVIIDHFCPPPPPPPPPSPTSLFSFQTNFCPFTPQTTWRIKILKKWKKHQEICYTCIPKIMIRWCMLPGIWSATDFLSFWDIFCPFTPLSTTKIKIWRPCKKTGDFILLHMCTIYEDHI